jgi:hypothetical protein
MSCMIKDSKVFRMRDHSSHSLHQVNTGQIVVASRVAPLCDRIRDSFRWFINRMTWVIVFGSTASALYRWSKPAKQRVAHALAPAV